MDDNQDPEQQEESLEQGAGHQLKFEAELDILKSSFKDSVAGLKEVVETLEKGTLPDSYDALRATSRLRSKFEKLSMKIGERRSELGIISSGYSIASLPVLEQEIASIRQYEQLQSDTRQRAEGAIEMLDAIDSLITIDGRELPVLAQCRRGAADLREKMIHRLNSPEFTPEELDELGMYEYILKVVSQEQGTSEEDLKLGEQVAAAFGVRFVVALSMRMITCAPALAIATEYSPEIAPVEQVRPATEQLHLEMVRPTETQDQQSESKTQDSSVQDDIPAESGHSEAVWEDQRFDGVIFAKDDSETVSEETPALGPSDAEAWDVLEAEPEPIAPLVGQDSGARSGFELYAGETTQSYAFSISPGDLPVSTDHVQRLVWLALGEQRFSAAYHLASCLAADPDFDSLELFPDRIRAVVLGNAIRTPIGPIPDQLKLDFSAITNGAEPESEELDLAFRLLMISAALRPAVFAPDTNAKSLLTLGSQCLPGLDKLYWICGQLAAYSNLDLPLDAVALEYIDSSATRAQQMAALQAEVTAWWSCAPKLNFKNAPAAKLWKWWLTQEGRLVD
jgi:hypothetical protein